MWLSKVWVSSKQINWTHIGEMVFSDYNSLAQGLSNRKKMVVISTCGCPVASGRKSLVCIKSLAGYFLHVKKYVLLAKCSIHSSIHNLM